MEEKCCNGAGDSKPPDYGGYIQVSVQLILLKFRL